MVVVVYHVTIVAIGHGLLKKFWPFVTRLRSTHCREFNNLKLLVVIESSYLRINNIYIYLTIFLSSFLFSFTLCCCYKVLSWMLYV